MRGNLFVLASLGLLWTHAATGADRPNVIVFLADDAGWGDFSCNGNSQVHTPNIDSLARQGVSLDRFYVCAVCARPGRSS